MVERLNGYGMMGIEKDGEFVRHSDYAALEAENARLTKERDEASALVLDAYGGELEATEIFEQHVAHAVSKIEARQGEPVAGYVWTPELREAWAACQPSASWTYPDLDTIVHLHSALNQAALYTHPAPDREPSPIYAMDDGERLCFDRAMAQWSASLKRPDLGEKDRVKGALLAYQRQAFALNRLPAPEREVTEAMVEAFVERYELGCNHRYDRNSIRFALTAALAADRSA